MILFFDFTDIQMSQAADLGKDDDAFTHIGMLQHGTYYANTHNLHY